MTGCILPSFGPLQENDTALPLSSTICTRHDSIVGVSFSTFKVPAFGAGSVPKLLCDTSIFHVPTCECSLCANDTRTKNVQANTAEIKSFRMFPPVIRDPRRFYLSRFPLSSQ